MRRLLLACLPAVALAAAPAGSDFAWLAPLEAPAGTLVRVALPGEALAQARSPGLSDLRVFDARGEPVAFALRRPPAAAAAPVAGATLPAHPLQRGRPAGTARGGPLQVELKSASGDSAWVQIGGPAPAGEHLPSVLVDLRAETRAVSALQVDAQLPANTPVRLSAFTSTDLADWAPLALRGSLFRFEGAPELDNRSLPLAVAQPLQGRYLRLDWDVPGVRVDSVRVLGAGELPRQRVGATLPAPTAVEGGLEWELPSTVAPAAITLSAARSGTLVPLRLLGRREPSQPWTPLAQTTVFRLGTPSAQQLNQPVDLPPVHPRWLRVEGLRGLPPGELSASIEFEPVEVVYLSTGAAQLAIGRRDTPAADVPLASVLAAAPGRRPDELPMARLGPAQVRPALATPAWLPQGVTPTTAALWAVLLAGVVVLGVVALRLLRQLRAP